MLQGSTYALRYTLSMHGLPLDDVVLCLERVAWAAAALRACLVAAAPPASGPGPQEPEAESARSAPPPVVHKHWID